MQSIVGGIAFYHLFFYYTILQHSETMTKHVYIKKIYKEKYVPTQNIVRLAFGFGF